MLGIPLGLLGTLIGALAGGEQWTSLGPGATAASPGPVAARENSMALALRF